MDINLELHDFQYNFLQTDKPEQLLAGGSGIGKTYIATLKLIKYLLEYPRSQAIACAATWDSTEKIIAESIISWANKLELPFRLANWRRGYRTIDFVNGSRVLLKNLQDSGKLKGHDVDIIYVDEATEVRNPDEIFEQLFNRLRSSSGYPKQFLCTTNPGLKSSWVYQFFYENHNHERQWRKTLPAYAGKHLPQEYFERLSQMTGNRRKALLEGLWCSVEGAAIDIQEDIHVKEFEEDASFRYYLSTDYGFDPDPAVYLLLAISHDRIYVIDEIEFLRTATYKHKDRLQDMVGKRQLLSFTGDVSAGSGEQRELITNTFNIKFRSPDKSRSRGWVKLAELFDKRYLDNQPAIYVHPRCRRTIESLQSLVWIDKHSKIDVEPSDDHHADALRYFIMTFYNRKASGSSIKYHKVLL